MPTKAVIEITEAIADALNSSEWDWEFDASSPIIAHADNGQIILELSDERQFAIVVVDLNKRRLGRGGG